MPFNALTEHRPSSKAYDERNLNSSLSMASESRRATDECAVPPLGIEVRTIQLSPYRAGIAGPCHTRLLTSPASPPCSYSLSFQNQVRRVASKSSALNFGPLWGQFVPCVPWRTVALHPAQAARLRFKGLRWQTVYTVFQGYVYPNGYLTFPPDRRSSPASLRPTTRPCQHPFRLGITLSDRL
jgi:hypothetical protein